MTGSATRGFEHFEEAKRRGQGFCSQPRTSGMGVERVCTRVMTEPMHVVVRPLDNPWIDKAVSHRRSLRCGNTLVAKKDAARAIMRALENMMLSGF